MRYCSLFPIKYFPPPLPAKFDQQILVNWLQVEVDPEAETQMPPLKKLRGWRNIEVFYFIREWPDWTARIYQ